jgi:uncharacterized protein YneR
MATRVYFFSNNSYVRFGSGTNTVAPGYPKPIPGNWPGIVEAEFENGFDSVVNWGNGKAYVFLAAKYLRYDIGSNKVDPGYPRYIDQNWHGTEALYIGGDFSPRLDAIMNWGNGKAYLFVGSKYLRYDIGLDKVDPGYPRSIAGNWPGLDEAGFTRIGSAVNWGNGKAYFFSYEHPSMYVRFDIGSDKVDVDYPKPIAGNWPGITEAGFTSGLGLYGAAKWGNGHELLFHKNQYLIFDPGVAAVDPGYPLPIAGNWPGMAEAGFSDKVDAVVKWWNGKVYFFFGDQYLRYDIEADRVDPEYPRPVAKNWPGMVEAGFASKVDAAVNWGNGKVYFFLGDKYLRYDIGADSVDPGYPLPIAGNWPGMAEAGFANKVDAVVNWGNGKVYFFLGDQYISYDIFADHVDPAYPRAIAEDWPGLTDAGFGGGVDAIIEW